MPAGLLDNDTLTAVFKAGKSALGHRWELLDGDGRLVGRTRRAYGGGRAARGVWRAVTATGMDANNDIRAEVLDGGERVVASLFSRKEKGDVRVELAGPDGSAIGVAHRRPGQGFEFVDAGGRAVGRIEIPDGAEDPWPLVDERGERLGTLGRKPAVRTAGERRLDVASGLAEIADFSRNSFQDTKHLGFAGSRAYGVELSGLPASEPLRTFAVLAPVIAGYAY